MTDGLKLSLSQFVADTKGQLDNYSKTLKSDKESSNKLSFSGDAKQAPSNKNPNSTISTFA
jgi:hypothetical protein